MRALLLTTLLITACYSEDEASISQSGDVTKNDLTTKNNPAYIQQGECLIDIDRTLTLGKNVELSQLGQCLPSSKLSWLFRAKKVEESIQAKQHMKLAVLLDTSSSLRDNDPEGERYKALRTYLLALFDKINSNDKGADALITSAEVQIYPFKYCDKRRSKVHILTVAQSKSRSDFEIEVDTLIGTNYTYKGKVGDVDKSFDKLTEYGAVGSTNYLHSLAKAIEFFDTASANDLKQVLIFSDGLPFTFNDGTDKGANNTINLSASKCGVEHKYDYVNLRAKVIGNTDKKFAPSNDIQACVTEEFYPKNTCVKPTANSQGQTNTGTNEPKAWSDPLNHVLGMVQHSAVINEAKADYNFQVYAVLLRPSNCDSVKNKSDRINWDKIICEEITAYLAKPFFESFASNYEEASKADELAKKLEATLDAQTRRINYIKHGTAHIDAGKGATEVDLQTKLHADNNRIKVGRDSAKDTVHDYAHDAQNTLTVAHGLSGKRSNSFQIDYDFTFASSKGEADCRSNKPSKIDSLEVNEYTGKGYTAWCLLSPRCDTDDQCCNPSNINQELTDEEGRKLCDDKEGNWIWVGVEGKHKVCACGCDPTDVAACQGKDQSWDIDSCTCVGAEAAPEFSPPQQSCDSARCDQQTHIWIGSPECSCKRKLPIVVEPPKPPVRPEKPQQGPDKNGKVIGGEDQLPEPAVNRGMVWGKYDSF